MFDEQIHQLTEEIRAAIRNAGITEPVAVEWNPIPFTHTWGLGTSVCLKAAALQVRAGLAHGTVAHIAQSLAESIANSLALPPAFERVEAARGYLNIYFEPRGYMQAVLSRANSAGPDYGRGAKKAERMMVEYIQPNTHHSIHIGHFRNAVLGKSLARLAEFAGFETIRASYPGDIGLGVIRCIWGYQKFHSGEEPLDLVERGRWLAQVYTEASTLLTAQEGESDADRARREGYELEVRDLYRLWDIGDPAVRELWRRTRQWSLDELQAFLDQLDIHMDVFFYESEADEPGKQIVAELIQRGIAEDERTIGGPVIIKLDEKLGLKKETYRTAVVLRSDGTSLYLTKDLALARIKFEQYHVDRSIYVVDVRQSLHFQQAFKILELWGFPQAAKCYHLAYEIVTLPEGTMSSRKGNLVFYQDVADEAMRRISAIIQEKNPELAGTERETAARQVGLGALTYAMLAVDNTKQIVFSWESALSFDGQAAPYIQYAHVRAASILARAGEFDRRIAPDYELQPSEVTLVDWISRFPAEVQRAALEYKPLHMANYAYALAKAFTEFYRECPVLQAEGSVRETRLEIVDATRQTLANSLHLLGIQAPSAM